MLGKLTLQLADGKELYLLMENNHGIKNVN